MTAPTVLLHAGESTLPVTMDQAFAVLGVAVAVVAAVAYLFYTDYRQVFWEVER